MNTLAKLATAPASTVSSSYKFIDTQRVIELLNDYGFTEDRYSQSRVRSPETAGYQKHVAIFNRSVDVDDEGGFNIMMLNSHDGTSSLRVDVGFFRILCSNQLVNSVTGIRIPHRGDVVSKLDSLMPVLFSQLQHFKEVKEQLKGMVLTDEQLTNLAVLACVLREVDVSQQNICRFIRPRRRGDVQIDAWTAYNVVQENVIRGGLRVDKTGEDGKVAYRKLKALSSADRIMSANKQLAELIETVRAA